MGGSCEHRVNFMKNGNEKDTFARIKQDRCDFWNA